MTEEERAASIEYDKVLLARVRADKDADDILEWLKRQNRAQQNVPPVKADMAQLDVSEPKQPEKVHWLFKEIHPCTFAAIVVVVVAWAILAGQ